MEKVSKILLKVAGWLMLALGVYMLVMNGLAVFDMFKKFVNAPSGEAAGNQFAYLVGFIFGSILGVIFRLIAGPKGIRLRKSTFAWGIVLVAFQVIGLVMNSAITWYVFLIDVFYLVAACLYKFTPKSSSTAETK